VHAEIELRSQVSCRPAAPGARAVPGGGAWLQAVGLGDGSAEGRAWPRLALLQVDDARELASRLFVTVYMGTVNSGEETRCRAARLAGQIGARACAAAGSPAYGLSCTPPRAPLHITSAAEAGRPQACGLAWPERHPLGAPARLWWPGGLRVLMPHVRARRRASSLFDGVLRVPPPCGQALWLGPPPLAHTAGRCLPSGAHHMDVKVDMVVDAMTGLFTLITGAWGVPCGGCPGGAWECRACQRAGASRGAASWAGLVVMWAPARPGRCWGQLGGCLRRRRSVAVAVAWLLQTRHPALAAVAMLTGPAALLLSCPAPAVDTSPCPHRCWLPFPPPTAPPPLTPSPPHPCPLHPLPRQAAQVWR
jgi:hypothetical protein